MKIEPLITIILPVYNADQFIEQAVQSVIHQTYANWELIIINDGSTDGTAAYLSSISNPKVHVIHQKNLGVSEARNAGLEQCQGDYITFLDADDVLPPRSLEVRANYLMSNLNVDVVDGVVSIRDKLLMQEIRCYQPYYQGLLFPRLLKLDDRVFFGIIYMFRSSLLKGARFDQNMSHSEDLFFYLSLASKSAARYGFVNEVIYFCRRGNVSAMSNMEGIEKGYLQLLTKLKYLDGVSLLDLFTFRIKVASILFLCWRSNGNLFRAVLAAAKSLR